MPKGILSDPKPLPTIEYLREALDYAPETGVLTWKERPRSHFNSDHAHHHFLARYAGKPAGSRMAQGYWRIDLDGSGYVSHRLAWCLYYSEWPSATIDHINLDKADNRISNLRDVARSLNTTKRAKYHNNSSGYTGITYRKNRRRWVARIQVENVPIFLGMYKDIKDAVSAYEQAKKRYGIAPNHGTAQPTVRPDIKEGHVIASNSSGATGVTWRSDRERWRANIRVNKVVIPLGSYRTKSEAIAARRSAEAKYGTKTTKGAGKQAIILTTE